MDRRSVTWILTLSPWVALICGASGYALGPRVRDASHEAVVALEKGRRHEGVDLWFDVDPVEVLPWTGGDVIAIHPGPGLEWTAYERRDPQGRLQLAWSRPGDDRIEALRVAGAPARLSLVAPAVAVHPQGLLVFSAVEPEGSQLYYQMPTSGPAARLWEGEVARFVEQPAFSQDGSRLAFIADGDLWSRDGATGAIARLTETGTIEAGPTWDPSGAWLYERDGDLWRVAEGGVPRALVQEAGIQRRVRAAGGTVAWYENNAGEVDLVVRFAGRDRVLARGLTPPERQGPALAPDGSWLAWSDGEGDLGTYVAFGAPDGSWVEGRWVDVRGASDLVVAEGPERDTWLYGTATLARQRIPWRVRVR